jgi:hypothetical protein
MVTSHHISLLIAAEHARDLREEARRASSRGRERRFARPAQRASRRDKPARRELRASTSRG